tara:strand:- start:2317 stop:2907 length:591 start_codon:yes stop_codon:yes gene_type:complete
MTNIIDLVEKIHQIDFRFFKNNKKLDIDFLKNYQNDKILLVGYNENYIYDNIKLEEQSIITNIDRYTLFVINKDFCRLTRDMIHRLVGIFRKYNKKVLFCGYGSYLNLNLENHKSMFRPIDITRYPFNLEGNYTVIMERFSKSISIKYLILMLFIIFTNIKHDFILYRISLILFILLLLIIPYRKYVLVKNKEKPM